MEMLRVLKNNSDIKNLRAMSWEFFIQKWMHVWHWISQSPESRVQVPRVNGEEPGPPRLPTVVLRLRNASRMLD